MTDYPVVHDCNGVVIEVGAHVDDPEGGGFGVVTDISDWDGDVDGETGRVVGFPPRVLVQYADCDEAWPVQQTGYMGEGPLVCDEVAVLTGGTA